MKGTPEERFWAKVKRGGPDECWLWTAAKHKFGYGQVCWGGSMTNSHRVSWRLAHGEIPAGLWVLHRCDVAACCNPAHLFLGTVQDNSQDMIRKGRQARGEDNGAAKLSDKDVEVLRERYFEESISVTELSKQFGISVAGASVLLSGESRADAGGPVAVGRKDRGEHNHNAKLSSNQVREILALVATKAISQADIGRQFGVTQNVISSISLGDSWKHIPGPRVLDRKNRGEHCYNAKLSEAQVREIRVLASKKEISQTEIGRQYGVSQSQVSVISRGKRWSHL